MEFARQEYWSALPFPSPGNLKVIKDFYGENGNTLNDLNKWKTIPNTFMDRW